MRLKLDENVGRSVQSLLEGAGHDVDTVLEEGLAGAADDAVLAAAVEDERALVTFDLGFANPFRFDPTGTTGIAVLRLPKSPDASQLAAVVDRLIEALRHGELRGHLWVVSIRGARAHRRATSG